MGAPPRSSPNLALRTAVFAALFIALAVGLPLGQRSGVIAPLPNPGPASWAAYHRRAGDTFVQMVYLAGVEPDSAIGRRFLRRAAGYYWLALRSSPSDIRTAVSLGLVLHAIRQDSMAKLMIARAARQPQPEAERKALSATLIVVSSTRSTPDQVAEAKRFVSGLAPGGLLLSAAYESMGDVNRAVEEWGAAEVEARRLVPWLAAMLGVCGLLTLTGLAGVVMAAVRLVRRRVAAPAPPSPAAWGMREAAEALVCWVALAVISTTLLARLGLVGGDREPAGIALLLPGLVADCGAIVWVWGVSPRGRGMGWAWAKAHKQILAGLAAAGAAAPVLLVLEQLLERLLGPAEHPFSPVLVAAAGWRSVLVVVVAVCVVVPVLEETLFRGILYRALRRNWGAAPSAGVSALVFAVGHMSWTGLLPYLLLGLLLAWLYERSGSLLAPGVAHGAFNAFNLAILLALHA